MYKVLFDLPDIKDVLLRKERSGLFGRVYRVYSFSSEKPSFFYGWEFPVKFVETHPFLFQLIEE